ncbi:MAG: Smr/MutS family protein [Desulfobulbaceae bacterium]|nr:MAG: Smr/MutS family protein [Desulfobulbaceae bacterium]
MTAGSREDDPPVAIPLDGILDLHAFSPKDIGLLVPDYLELCHSAGIYQLRIIHGKGVGHLRRSVHAILARHPLVRKFTLAGQDAGSWGATLVELRVHPREPAADKS